jgi:hypothetical protein
LNCPRTPIWTIRDAGQCKRLKSTSLADPQPRAPIDLRDCAT